MHYDPDDYNNDPVEDTEPTTVPTTYYPDEGQQEDDDVIDNPEGDPAY